MPVQDNIIIFGPPRSGTTWLANILSFNDDVHYIHEPDNEKNNFLAAYYKRNLSRFPYLKAEDRNKDFAMLFQLALKGKFIESDSKTNQFLMGLAGINKTKIESEINTGKKAKRRIQFAKLPAEFFTKVPDSGKRRIVKTVHAHLSIPFLLNELEFSPLIMVRHPASVISSHIKLRMPDANRQVYKEQNFLADFLLPYMDKIKYLKSELEFFSLQLSIFHHIISRYKEKYHLNLIQHEELCQDPIEKFHHLYNLYNLEWNEKVEQYILSLNQEGKDGYDIQRNCKKLSDKWKSKFNKEEIEMIERTYSILPNDLGYTF